MTLSWLQFPFKPHGCWNKPRLFLGQKWYNTWQQNLALFFSVTAFVVVVLVSLMLCWIRNKVGLLGFNARHTLLMPYLLELLLDYQPAIQLCSPVLRTNSCLLFYITCLFHSCFLGVELSWTWPVVCCLSHFLQVSLRECIRLFHLNVQNSPLLKVASDSFSA